MHEFALRLRVSNLPGVTSCDRPGPLFIVASSRYFQYAGALAFTGPSLSWAGYHLPCYFVKHCD